MPPAEKQKKGEKKKSLSHNSTGGKTPFENV